MEYIRVKMIRDNLESIPQHALPDGYSIEFFKPGDETSWANIWSTADEYETYDVERFNEAFGDDLPSMKKRCLFLVSPNGEKIGTATAWIEEDAVGAWARLHWVAVRNDFQSRGIGKPLLSAVMNLSKDLGFQRVLLYTETARLPAIKLYLDFGFLPDLTYPEAQKAWELISSNLKHAALSSVK